MSIHPRFQHDCHNCIFVGNVTVNGVQSDMYFCEKNITSPTVIVRHSNDISDYVSGLKMAQNGVFPLSEAFKASVESGLINTDTLNQQAIV